MLLLKPQKAFLRVSEIRSFVDVGADRSIVTMRDGTTYYAQERAGVLFEDQVDNPKDAPEPWNEWAEIFLVPSVEY
jgi:hypothetical protein